MTDRSSVALKALRELKELRGEPSDLANVLSDWSRKQDINPFISVQEFLDLLQPASHSTATRHYFHNMLATWDYQPEFPWSRETEPSTAARRAVVYELLGLAHDQADWIGRLFPVYPRIDQPIHITAHDPAGPNWYTAERQQESNFYWRAYERYLRDIKEWDAKNISVLDVTSSLVVSDLRDPREPAPRTSKGLVVGYVQSGKTANFTGVIAKAIDAGYRLIIVLAGMQNTLRDQTQRRLDKELVGKEVLSITDEYNGDDDWNDFNAHGGVPAHLGAFNIDRLTTSSKDFRHPFGDTSRLAYHRADRTVAFNHPANAAIHPAKLVVIKKYKTPLEHLLNALTQAEMAGTPWSQVPSLIIDDESDQASLDTSRPTASQRQARTTINKLIVAIMGKLKRAQYVGYTATPFANVFVDPDDAEDLFPSDFLLPLPRPDGYMGVVDFYDPRGTPRTPRDPLTNFGRYVRSVAGDNDTEGNLPQALDAFVLSGAIKLFRSSVCGQKYKHHTMLVHVTTRVDDHADLRDEVATLFAAAGYASGGPGFSRLETLWKSDFQPICGTHDSQGAVPQSFNDIRPFIGACVSRIGGSGSCAIVLNGTDTDEAPDFDATSVWKIIVGGAKLSRGYTVEGLTVSYYRRVAGAADTLMQMGRWFGYRHGYRDLVRLYIGTNEPLGRSGTIDLYEAFRGVCDDEEEFRAQLERYSRLRGDERLTPKQVPPLVPSHLLLPTARNKMYNATVLFVNFGEEHKQSTLATKDEGLKRQNETAMKDLLRTSRATRCSIHTTDGTASYSFPAYAGCVSPDDMLAFLKTFKRAATRAEEGDYPLILEYVEGRHGDPAISSWTIVAPQFANESGDEGWPVPDVGNLSIRERARVGDNGKRYNVFTESRHVDAARLLAGHSSPLRPSDSFTSELVQPGRAVMLFYPVRTREEGTDGKIPTMGFSLLFPRNHIARRIRYGVRLAARPDDITVDAGIRGA